MSYSEIEEDKFSSTWLKLSLRDFNVQTYWCPLLELLVSPGVEAAICDSSEYAVIFFFCQKVFSMAFPLLMFVILLKESLFRLFMALTDTLCCCRV